jgi:hypothetical protein
MAAAKCRYVQKKWNIVAQDYYLKLAQVVSDCEIRKPDPYIIRQIRGDEQRTTKPIPSQRRSGGRLAARFVSMAMPGWSTNELSELIDVQGVPTSMGVQLMSAGNLNVALLASSGQAPAFAGSPVLQSHNPLVHVDGATAARHGTSTGHPMQLTAAMSSVPTSLGSGPVRTQSNLPMPPLPPGVPSGRASPALFVATSLPLPTAMNAGIAALGASGVGGGCSGGLPSALNPPALAAAMGMTSSGLAVVPTATLDVRAPPRHAMVAPQMRGFAPGSPAARLGPAGALMGGFVSGCPAIEHAPCTPSRRARPCRDAARRMRLGRSARRTQPTARSTQHAAPLSCPTEVAVHHGT